MAGKISLIQLESLILYFLLFIVGSVILTFWVLPAVISALTDFPIKHVLKEMKDGIIMGAVTTISATAIPYVIEAIRKLAAERNIDDEKRDEIIKTTVSITYPYSTVGQSVCIHVYVLFLILFQTTS